MKRTTPGGIEYHFFIEKKDSRPAQIKQVHGTNIVKWDGKLAAGALPEADGIYTLATRTPVYVFTADCLPVLLAGEEPDSPVAAVHAGWRGAKAGIVRKAMDLLWPYTTKLHAILGPSILECCFEVKDDFVAEFEQARGPIDPFLERRNGKLYFKLAQFVVDSELADIPTERLHLKSVRCTACSQPELPSFRRNKGTDPRICAWIAKTPPRDKVSR